MLMIAAFAMLPMSLLIFCLRHVFSLLFLPSFSPLFSCVTADSFLHAAIFTFASLYALLISVRDTFSSSPLPPCQLRRHCRCYAGFRICDAAASCRLRRCAIKIFDMSSMLMRRVDICCHAFAYAAIFICLFTLISPLMAYCCCHAAHMPFFFSLFQLMAAACRS